MSIQIFFLFLYENMWDLAETEVSCREVSNEYHVFAEKYTVDSRYLDPAYLEANIWSLLKHENLTTGNKILWKRGEIAPKEQFLLFSALFSVYL